MSSKAKPAGSRATAILSALIVLITGCVITFWLNNWQQDNIERRMAERFSFDVSNAAARVERRLQHYENLLMGARGLFAASQNVDRNEFSKYNQGIELESRFPAAQGLGFARLVRPLERQSYELAVQEEGFADFSIWPGYGRKTYTSVHFIEPFSGVNRKAFGYDMYAEHDRHKAMERAMLQDTTAMSRQVELVDDGQQGNSAGILIFIPVYDNAKSSETISQRREAVTGWTYAVVRVDQLISQTLSTLHPELRITVNDGVHTPGQGNALYSTHQTEDAFDSPFQETKVISFGGREWSLAASASQSWIEDAGLSEIDHRLLVGVFLSFALALCLYLTLLGRSNALDMVRRQTRELQLQHDTLLTQTHEIKDRAWRLQAEAQTRRKVESEGLALDSILHELESEVYMLSGDSHLSIRRANRFAEKCSGLNQNELRKQTLYDRFDPRDTRIIKDTVEQMLRENQLYRSVSVGRVIMQGQSGSTGELDRKPTGQTTRMQVQLHFLHKGDTRIMGAVVVASGMEEGAVDDAA